MSDEGREGENRRVYWHSRRGMVELDVLLMPYALEVYPSLDDEQRAQYRQLLECEDADLFAWMMRSVSVDDPTLALVVDRVLEHGRSKAPNPT